MGDVPLRNVKEFLELYNKITETCFSRCIDEMNSRFLNNDEAACIEHCSSKFISFNHRLMSLYVNIQATLINKRIQEAETQSS